MGYRISQSQAFRQLARKQPDDYVYSISLHLQGARRLGKAAEHEDAYVLQTAGWDHSGFLQFADNPEKAPVVHFNGPWHLGMQLPFLGTGTLSPATERELEIGLGSPGLGAGTFSFAWYDKLIPKTLHPVADIEFPPKLAGQKGIKVQVTLTKRC